MLLIPAVWGAFQGIREVTEPEAFADYSGVNFGFTRPGEQGKLYTFGLTYDQQLPNVTMTSVNAIVAKGSVAAAITISICRVDPTKGDDVGTIGAVEGDLSESCSEVVPVVGQDLGQPGNSDTLIVTVVPLVDGSVHVTGFDFAYHDDGRLATERIAVEMNVG